ncbi:MAG: carboxypeptidase-like regulatory domain-containing protein [Alphaproteobacteria bacterium]|nr:carboxypeptidase-like regulatory domain-containing protein [Alphaproteobacteria bacterium]
MLSGLLLAFAAIFLFGLPAAIAQNADALTDILKGGSGSPGLPAFDNPAPPVTTFPATTLPGFEPSQPALSTPQPQQTFETDVTTLDGTSLDDTSLELRYDGEAAGDGRRARLDLSFDGNVVTGTMWIQSVCEQNIHLGGADLNLRATLSGVWESKEGSIDGTWEGTEHFCGTDAPNHGTFKFFLKDDGYFDPVLHMRIEGENGRYGWNFPPTNKVYIDGGAADPGATPSDDADPGKDGKTDDDKDDGKDPPPDEIDPDSVTDVILLPSLLAMSPGEFAELPFVQAVVGDEAQRVYVPDSSLRWGSLPAGSLEMRDGKFFLRESAKDGEEIPFEVLVTLGERQWTLAGKVRVYGKQPLGSISGFVTFDYSPGIYPYPALDPKSAEVELHRGTTLGAPIAVIMANADGSYRFENLPEGYYVIGVRKLVPPDFPPGYVLDTGSAPWRSMTVSIPDEVWVEAADAMQVVWDRQHISVSAKVRLPPKTEGAIYGRVHYRDKGIEGVTVIARQVGSTGVKREVTSGRDGVYILEIDDLPGGTYWITAEKYVTPRWAGPDDLLDIASTRQETPILVSSPLSDPRGLEFHIELDTRIAIFGGSRTPVEPITLPGEG